MGITQKTTTNFVWSKTSILINVLLNQKYVELCQVIVLAEIQ